MKDSITASKQKRSVYSAILSDLVKDTFNDAEDLVGTNATGVYLVKMRLAKHIPQLLPLDGRRTIIKLCNNCFQKHPGKHCKTDKAL